MKKPILVIKLDDADFEWIIIFYPSLQYLNHLLYPPHYSYYIIHQLIPVHRFYLQLPVALRTFLCVPPLATQTVIVPARNDGYGVNELVTKRALNLGYDGIVHSL